MIFKLLGNFGEFRTILIYKASWQFLAILCDLGRILSLLVILGDF